jgi:hypothetical protein
MVPLVGPFHLRFPRYNAVTVRDVVAAEAPELVLTTALPADAFDAPRTRAEVLELAGPFIVTGSDDGETDDPMGNETDSPTGNETDSPAGNETDSPTGNETDDATGNETTNETDT